MLPHSTFTGKELDLETGYSYFGARYLDNALSTAWLSVDPMSEKYPSISPYAYCSWNPVKLVDPDGRIIKLSRETEYVPGMSSDKYEGVDKMAIDALNLFFSTAEGQIMINKLCESTNVIDICEGFETEIEVQGPAESFYNEETLTPGDGLNIKIDIYWNIKTPEGVPTLEGIKTNSTYNLLDEICHAYDYCTGYGTDGKTDDGYSKAEYQAVYRSNVVRHQLKDFNYRSAYDIDDKTKGHIGPETASIQGFLKKRHVFYQPSWYPRCETDNSSHLLQHF